MKKFCILLTFSLLLAVVTLNGQQTSEPPTWYIGVNGGYRGTFPSFSKINSEFYPKNTSKSNGVFALFLQGEFGEKRQFGVRPEIAFLSRGGGLSNIGIHELDYQKEGIEDIFYRIRSNYIDVRVPLVYNFGTPQWKIRPYVYIAPVFGFSTGGKMYLQETLDDNSYAGYEVNLNDANYNSFYFAGVAALGARYSFPLGSSDAFIGMEIMYEYGFTDTYGAKEKKGDALNVNPMFPQRAIVEGSRKYQGLEIKVIFGVPFAAFAKKAVAEPEIIPTPILEPEPAILEDVVIVREEKPCYSLDEIVDMMAHGENVYGKTICAIEDDINFDFGKANIKPASYEYLNRLAETLKRTNAHIIVKGHTDNIGSEESNMALSKKRAENVLKYLQKLGVVSSRLSCEFYGMSRPIYTNETEEGRARNRRVEFEIVTE